MQIAYRNSLKFSDSRNLSLYLCLGTAVGLFSCVGCESAAPSVVSAKKKFAEVTLRIGCTDQAYANEIQARASSWATRTGANVTVAAELQNADVAVIPPAEIGEFAARGELANLPDEFIQPTHPLQWNAILPAYSRTLSSWGGRIVALPLAGDGAALVIRKDRLGKAGRPTTWTELAEFAEASRTRGGQPSLAPLPANPTRLVNDFCRLAASMDRKAVTLGAGSRLGEQSLGFQFDLSTGKPRLTAPGFVAAAEWLARTQRYRPATPSDDPVAALDAGTAVAAVLTLAELARLPRDPMTGAVSEQYAVSKPPASRYAFDKDGNREEVSGGGNAIPYLGSTTMTGVVFAKSSNAAAAWDFLGDTASVPGSLAMMANPTLGAGPIRGEQIEESRFPIWLVYGFDPAGTRALADAVRFDLALEVGNPTSVLRVPGQAELVEVLAKHIRRAATGVATPQEALKAASVEWEAITAKSPNFRDWLRAAAGLQ